MGAERDLTGAVFLVTGSSGGIGSCVVAELAGRGADVIGCRLHAHGTDPSSTIGADLRSPDEAERVLREAVRMGGRLDGIVNALGVVAFGNVEDLTDDALEEMFLVNTFAPIFVSRAGLEVLEPGGCIVNVSGIVAESPLAGMAAYAASKAALRAFDTAFAREARRRNITVVDARPPHTETGLANRPIEGAAPDLPVGLTPEVVAARIVDAIAHGERDLPSAAFD